MLLARDIRKIGVVRPARIRDTAVSTSIDRWKQWGGCSANDMSCHLSQMDSPSDRFPRKMRAPDA